MVCPVGGKGCDLYDMHQPNDHRHLAFFDGCGGSIRVIAHTTRLVSTHGQLTMRYETRLVLAWLALVVLVMATEYALRYWL